MTEKQLRQAAEEYVQALAEGLDAPEEHTFSRRFERGMRGLLAKSAHPAWAAFGRAVASFAMVMLVLFGSVLAVDAEARELFLGWFRQQMDGAVHFSSRNPSQEDTQYQLTWIPEGYEFYDSMQLDGGEDILYVNEAGDFFAFSYQHSSENGETYFFPGEHEEKHVSVQGTTGTLYLPHDKTNGKDLIWQNEAGTLFEISGRCDEAVLLRAAESVSPKQ